MKHFNHSLWSNRDEVTHPVSGAEKFDARPVREKDQPELENLVIFIKDFVGVVHTVLKQAPIAATNLQHDFGVTNEMDQELQHFLISRTEGEALEVVRGDERDPGLEQWR